MIDEDNTGNYPALISTPVEATAEVKTIDKDCLGPIDNENIILTIEETIDKNTLADHSTYWEVRLNHTDGNDGTNDGNIDATNAHGGDYRPVKVWQSSFTTANAA